MRVGWGEKGETERGLFVGFDVGGEDVVEQIAGRGLRVPCPGLRGRAVGVAAMRGAADGSVLVDRDGINGDGGGDAGGISTEGKTRKGRSRIFQTIPQFPRAFAAPRRMQCTSAGFDHLETVPEWFQGFREMRPAQDSRHNEIYMRFEIRCRPISRSSDR